MNQQEISKEIYEFFKIKERTLVALRDKTNTDIGSLRAKSIAERRGFYKSFSFLVAALLGLSPIMVNSIKLPLYFLVSIIIYVALLFLILGYLREIYDKEDYSLTSQSNRYNHLIQQGLDLVRKYMIKGNFAMEDLQNYDLEKSKINGLDNLMEETTEVKRAWGSGITTGLYVGELFIFLFILATIFSGLSILLDDYLDIKVIVLVIIITYSLSITNFAEFVIKVFSWLPTKLKKQTDLSDKHKG